MSFFLINSNKPKYVAIDIVGPFDTFAMATSYKETLPYADEYTVETTTTPDLSKLGEKFAISVVVTNSTVYIDGTTVKKSTNRVRAIRDLITLTGLSIKEARLLVDRVKFAQGEFSLIAEWEADLLNDSGNVPSTTPVESCDCDDCTSFVETETVWNVDPAPVGPVAWDEF